jgi:hypothetical protein
MPRVSPAAVAAVARKLAPLGLPRCTELRNRMFAPGWEVGPQGDHVRVSVMPDDGDPDSAWCQRILHACEAVLRDSYDVRRVRTSDVVLVGGFGTADVLEVRRRS